MQQSTIKNPGAATTPGLPTQKSTSPQTRPSPQRVAVTNAQVQRNSTTPSSVQTQRSATPSAAAVPLNQGLPRSMSNQPIQYQPLTWPPKSTVATAVPLATPSAVVVPLNQGVQRSVSNQPIQYQPLTWPPKSTTQVQNSATVVPALVPSNQLQKGSQGPVTLAQPANQYMWVPASAVQQNMPMVYVNPVAPSLQGGPMFVSYPQAGQFIPQQAPVMLMTSQPSSTSRLPRTTTQTAITTRSGSGRGVTPVSNRPSAGTVTTFSVLPQNVGQSAVQSAKRHDIRKVKQPATTVNQPSVNGSSLPSSSKPPVVASFPQSSHQTTSVAGQLLSTGLPLTAFPQQSTPPRNTAAPSQRLPNERSQSESSHQTTSVQSQLPSTGLSLSSSLPQSSPPSVNTAAPSKRLPNAVVSTPNERSQSESYQTTSVRSQLPSTGLLSSPPSGTTASPSQRLLDTEVSSSSEGTQSQESLPGSQRPRESDGSVLVSDDSDASTKDLHPPLRRAGRTITWRDRTQGKSKLQEQRKSLSKDLRG